MNFAHTDPALTAVVDRWTAEADRETLNGLLDRLGRDAAGRLSELADIADKNPPVLQQFDKAGDRVDRISYHPAYLELCRAAYNEYGLSAMSHPKRVARMGLRASATSRSTSRRTSSCRPSSGWPARCR